MAGLFSISGAPLSSRTSAGVADIIRREILVGTLKPEQPLLEREIASELGVSRTPVREALFALQGEGLVELVPRRNARVRKITDVEISQIYALRHVLEVHAASSAAEYATPQDFLAIETALMRQKNLPRTCSALEQAEADLAFHAAVAAASHSQIVLTVVTQVLALTATLRGRIKYDASQMRRVLAQHGAVLTAIKNHDPDRARAEMSDHIDASTCYAKTRLPSLNDENSSENRNILPQSVPG
ncbi:GntR family transcriptional regulator [Acetobacter conturbans]|uniref:FCD domain-containing protein n=1 Tax=Acetobacter conturbans TaxID=1737472 RepID=A0ABX0K5G0_9PROT|nr:GntR family transcriptional regulator [Acetobacter conturbans]NHN90081.1 FCD domain-containing protein [Acetobacter conturbans]